MDAYDIFKKLTKGLKFNNKLLGPKIESHLPKVPKNEPEPLDELLDEEIIYNSEDDHSSGSEHEDTAENGFELLQGVKIGPKKKKRKIKERSEELKNKLKVQEENHFRNQHGIRVVGRHIPAALPDFSILIDHYQVSEAFVNTIKDCGYAEPTPIQRQVLTCMLENRQILACAPTGSGKTAAFLIPILHMLGAPQGGPRALILCPTRELAKQIYREALRLSASTNLRCSVVNKIQESKIKERESTIKKSDIVISTPNRLCYLLNIENINITLDKVKWLIVDEADKMFEGSAEQDSDFRQQLEQIMTRCGGRERRMAMFSATHTPAVGKWCRHNLRGLINITVGQRNAATDLVDQELLYCGNESGKLVAFRQLVQQGLKPPVLVFVQSKDRAKQLFKELIYDGINVDVIHADRTQTQGRRKTRYGLVRMPGRMGCVQLARTKNLHGNVGPSGSAKALTVPSERSDGTQRYQRHEMSI
ncbi:Probable ATP-dependent RNA helicase DDX52 [Eumeta japonica]|uniref:RNA helicase n=1 Tax=Eumeta variegata TaxID=151549 RepID=A0A4C1TPW3_EUMVA|nr:Probable ATP-dependent RNA helicase DDX52 [Eumeta japonica]